MSEAPTVELCAPTGERFTFSPGTICLALVATGGRGERAIFEQLDVPDDLRRWVELALGLRLDTIGEADFISIADLRETVWELANAVVDARALPEAGVAHLNRVAAHPDPAPAIVAVGDRRWQPGATIAHVASLLARDAVELFTGSRAARVQRCEAHDCTLLFVDTSRPGSRRWCSMQRCGNRAKVRAFRDRHHQEGPP